MPEITRIYLIGFMGSGKTTLGKELAALTGYSFTDLDPLIEKNTGKTIPELFKEQGESSFRTIEKQMLDTTFSLKRHIIATGGGAPCYFDNMARMNKHGTTIYLNYSPQTLEERLRFETASRPLLEGKSGKPLISLIKTKLAARDSFYHQAHYILNESKISAPYIQKLLQL